MRVLGRFRIDRAHVEHSDEVRVGSEDRRAAAAQAAMARAKMLRPVDGHWALLRDAGADSVRTLRILRPDATLPDAPVAELVGAVRIATHVDHHTLRRRE